VRRAVHYLEGMERVELHFHLLPGVDDGPPDLATALELARAAVRDGTRLVTCTPHAAFVDLAEIPERVRGLQAALGEAGIDLEVRTGAELSWDDVPGLGGAELETIAQGPPARRWLLLEAPLPGTGTLVDLQESAQELRDRGFGLLIGHPERSPALVGAPGAVEGLLDAGDRLQVNGSSLTGYHGAGARAAALELVGAGFAAVVASDAHLPTARAPSLSPAVALLRSRGTPAEQAEALVAAAPRALLEHGIAPRRRLAA
jgi:protein-tyrosine phosphatase